MLNSCKLHHVTPEEVARALEAVAAGGNMLPSARVLDAAVAYTLGGRLDRTVSTMIATLFEAHARSEGASLSELESGISVLCAGSKSEKLALAFQLFDEDGDGCLTRRQLWKFLRCFLKTLLVLTEAGRGMSTAERHELVDNAVVEYAARIFDEAQPEAGPSRLSFDEFGAWYNADGHEVLPWLELLDARKWPNIRLTPAPETASSEATTSSAAAAAAPTAQRGPVSQRADDAAVFRFPLSVDSVDDESLSIYQGDVDNLRMIVSKTKLHTLAPARMHETFEAAAKQGVLDKAAFDDCVRRLVPGHDLDEKDKSWLSFALSNVFYSYDRTGNGFVDVTELASGFTLFGSGSKSGKLLLAFQAFDKDNDGLLSKRGLWKYLRSFLTVLLSLAESMLDVPMADVERVVDNGAVRLTETVFAQATLDRAGSVSFEEFAEWYTNGGFETAPFLELLDLGKWPFEETQASGSAPNASATASSDAAVFEFPLSVDSVDDESLSIYQGDVDNLRMIVSKTKLHTLAPARMHETFEAAAKQGVLDKAAFDDCVRRLVPGHDLDEKDKSWLSFALSNVFYSYDRSGDSCVDTRELASGFSLFASGNKSEKLLLAFQAFDDDNDGLLSKRGLWKYLRSFLTVLLSLVQGMLDVPMEDMAAIVDNGAVQLTETVFASCGSADGSVAFEQFADWYTNGGFETAPWLELLDLRKWG